VIVGAGRRSSGRSASGTTSKIAPGSVVNKECAAQLDGRRESPGASSTAEGTSSRCRPGGGNPDRKEAIKCLTEQIFALEKRVEELAKRLEEAPEPRRRRTGT